jgi:hypothetical protein
VGETRVDLVHLLEDLRDAYPGGLEETILTEIVANALDSGASCIHLAIDPAGASFTAVDDGSGMRRRELARYHDVAASTKARGDGIGFAGVGIKLGLLVCEEVVTETRRGTTHVASRWHLASRHRAPWRWLPPPGLVSERGTAVRLQLRNALSPLLDRGFIEASIRRHFRPLLDPAFEAVLRAHYPRGVRIEVNGTRLEPAAENGAERASLALRVGRQRKPSAVGWLLRGPAPLPEERRGVAVSTFGKVIKQGWDWLGVSPSVPEHIGGLIEVPALAAALTLNKADFIRTGARGAIYLTYRKAVQEAVSRQLAAWGDARDAAEESRRRAARPLERDLERVLLDLADDFPLLATLVERRRNGQGSLPIGRTSRALSEVHAATAAAAHAETDVPVPLDAAKSEMQAGPGASELEPTPSQTGAIDTAGDMRRSGRLGLSIQFDERPDDPELGRLVESTVWVNVAHPAYRRAAASRAEGYHVALTVALALAPLAVEPASEHGFVSTFLARWGEVVVPRPSSARARRGARPRASSAVTSR